MHWLLDVVMDEDYSRVRTAHALENLALLCRLACNLLQCERNAAPPDRSPLRFKELIPRAARDGAFRSRLLDRIFPRPAPRLA